ncbi:MAG: C4-dicarboxylate ABC transporter substrate-binding protein [Alphaproteobacteria bacterium]|nr:MAG: C4-dicarboxylate ABC transporter substrate-binding protein [Alphaproteobacteria bacterium]
MRLPLLAALSALLLVGGGAPPLGAAEFEKNIMTGGPSGTYIQIGRDVAGLAAECGQILNVVESAGSLENLGAVRNRPFTQFGIVQSDVLEYVNTFAAADDELRDAIRGVRIMYPLYNEEVHVLARREIASLAGLAGRKVAIGKVDSGNYLTASLVLDILRVGDAERIAINPDEALPKVLAGEIDAMFYVAGAPTRLFADAAIDAAKFHLLPITEAPLRASYAAAAIPAGTYPFQSAAVEVIAVKAVLMTYDYNPARSAYHRQSCKAASDMASLILTHLDRLREKGHPKWKDVDLAAIPPGWQVSACVKAGMAADYRPACAAPAADSAPEAGSDREYLELLKQRLRK